MGCQPMSTVNAQGLTSRIFINNTVRTYNLVYVYFGVG